MIISHKYKYVFVEYPRTGSTAIAAELQAHYDGQSILSKHSHYSSFLRIASDEEKSYVVASGIRNPLDDAVSWYEKYRTRADFALRKSYPERRRYEFVQKPGTSFAEFLKHFYHLPHDNWSSAHHHQFDLVIRFEDLQQGFSQFIDLIGATQVRPLPLRNKTSEKGNYLDYYSNDVIRHAVWIFGPYMEAWRYELPAEWSVAGIPWSSRALFHILRQPRIAYWTNVRQRNARFGTLFHKLFLASKR